jgi:AcrR family transcriptional regulator
MGAVASEQPLILPVAGPPAELTERVDAARNRAKILAAAEQLIAERGIEHVSIDDVARAACVGKGTIYRRFGDRAGLAIALLGEQEREFQDELIRGDAPLGPGAEPRERILAFGDAYLDLLEQHAPLLAAAEAGPDWRGGLGPVAFYRTHLTVLAQQADPDCDAELVAVHLLHALSPALFLHLRRQLEIPLERVKAGWRRQVDGWLAASREDHPGP